MRGFAAGTRSGWRSLAFLASSPFWPGFYNQLAIVVFRAAHRATLGGADGGDFHGLDVDPRAFALSGAEPARPTANRASSTRRSPCRPTPSKRDAFAADVDSPPLRGLWC